MTSPARNQNGSQDGEIIQSEELSTNDCNQGNKANATEQNRSSSPSRKRSASNPLSPTAGARMSPLERLHQSASRSLSPPRSFPKSVPSRPHVHNTAASLVEELSNSASLSLDSSDCFGSASVRTLFQQSAMATRAYSCPSLFPNNSSDDISEDDPEFGDRMQELHLLHSAIINHDEQLNQEVDALFDFEVRDQ